MAALATPDVLSPDATDPTEAVRLRVEQVLAAEQVNLTSSAGTRAHRAHHRAGDRQLPRPGAQRRRC